MKLWSIFSRDGHLLGRYSAVASETAFREYMVRHGRDVSERDIICEPLTPTMEQITFEAKEYFLIPDARGRNLPV